MKRLTLLLVAMLVTLGVAAQSADGRYTSRMTQDGTLFFVMPQKIGKLSGIKRFEYDMTMLTWTDSVTVNFTFESDRMSLPENLEIVSGANRYACADYSPLFIDIKKKHYEVRITSKFPADQIKSIVGSATPPVFSFTQDGVPESATYSEGAWRKDRKKLSDIYQLYLYSRK